jgi:glucokinase
MKPGVRCALGIDVGGTKIAGGIVTFPNGHIAEREVIPTRPARGGEAVLEDVRALAERLQQHAASRQLVPTALGIGLAELVDREGRVASAATIRWQHLPAHERLSTVLPTRFEADVRAAARAEAGFGAGRAYRQFLYVTVGTGISCCLMLDGQPHTGARGLAGTFASSSSLVPNANGQPFLAPSLETFASGPGLVAQFRAHQADFIGDAPEICALANAGDALAREIVDSASRCLGAAIAQLVNVLDPEAVVLGGGLGLAGGRFQTGLEPAFREHCWSPLHREVPLLSAQTGADAGIIGSAWAALLGELGESGSG